MNPRPPVERERTVSGVAEFFRAGWKRAGLWLDDDYRRDAFRLMVLGLRGMVGVRLGVALALLAAAGVYLYQREVHSPREGYELLAALFAAATLLAAAPIYASEQRQGTFELLWLATGSEAAMLRAKVGTMMLGLTLLMVPAVGMVSWYFYGALPVVRTIVFLLTNSLFIIAVMALAGTLLPQAWAGGLAGAAVCAGLYFGFHDSVSAFNVFLNPVDNPGAAVAGGGAFAVKVSASALAVPNRLVTLAVSLLLLGGARARLKRTFR